MATANSIIDIETCINCQILRQTAKRKTIGLVFSCLSSGKNHKEAKLSSLDKSDSF